MNIFEEFRNAAAAGNNADAAMRSGQSVQQGMQQQSANTNNQVPSTATPGSDGKGPAAFPATPSPDDKDKSPLSGYTELWKNDPNAKPVDNLAAVAPKFNTDPAKLAEAVKGMDFAKVIPADVMAGMQKGDPAALAAGLNAVTQAAFMQSANATTKIVEAAVTQTAQKMMEDVLPRMVRESAISNHLHTENPLLSNPATAPLVEMLQKQVQSKYPNATAADINTQVSGYLADFAKLVTESGIGMPAASDTSKPQVGRKMGLATDSWEDFFASSK